MLLAETVLFQEAKVATRESSYTVNLSLVSSAPITEAIRGLVTALQALWASCTLHG